MPITEGTEPSRVHSYYGFDRDLPKGLPSIQIKVPAIAKVPDLINPGIYWAGNGAFWDLLTELGETHHDRLKCVLVDRKGQRSNDYSVINVRQQFNGLVDGPGEVDDRVMPGEPFPLDAAKVPPDRHFFQISIAILVSELFRKRWGQLQLKGIEFRSLEEF